MLLNLTRRNTHHAGNTVLNSPRAIGRKSADGPAKSHQDDLVTESDIRREIQENAFSPQRKEGSE